MVDSPSGRVPAKADVVIRLHDPTDPSTEHTAPSCSAHARLDDVPRTLDLVEAKGEFHQHDGVATVMMKLPAQGFAYALMSTMQPSSCKRCWASKCRGL